MKESLELFEDQENRACSSPADVRPTAEIEAALVVRDLDQGPKGTRFSAVASTGSTDRDGESIDPNGWVVAAPTIPIFFGHAGYRDPANWIGNVERTFTNHSGFNIEGMLFDAIPEATNAKLIAGIMRLGVKPPGSVGFDPYEWTERDGRKGSRAKGENFPGPSLGRRYTKQELLEWSVVPVPSNIDSIVTGLKMLTDGIGRGTSEGLAASLMALNRLTAAPELTPEQVKKDELASVLETLDELWPEARSLVRRVLEERSSQERALSALERSLLDRFGQLPWQTAGQESAGLAGE
jgi:hypothetical protein